MLVFYVFYLKEKCKRKSSHKRNINSKRSNVYIGNQYYYYLGLPKITIGWACTTKYYVALT